VSALYHRRLWSPKAYEWMKRADHSMIFLFIAGTYTPFMLLASSQPTGYIVLAVVWGGAIGGVVLKMLWPHAPRWLGVPIYIALGWVAVFVLPEMATHAGIAPGQQERGGGLVEEVCAHIGAKSRDVGAAVVDTEHEPARQLGQYGLGLNGVVQFGDQFADIGCPSDAT